MHFNVHVNQDARGDQCDACSSLLNPTELINPRCKVTGATPIPRSTRHVFLDLPKLTPPLQGYIDTTSAAGGWSSNCLQVTRAWMRDGLRPRCITRDLTWGTPVPMAGFESKVFYVWFDAPIGYISITADYCGDWERWWKNPEDVELVQFMGKDNVPFHTVIFPATLLGTGERWTLMQSISVTEYLNYESGKFSKSRGVGTRGRWWMIVDDRWMGRKASIGYFPLFFTVFSCVCDTSYRHSVLLLYLGYPVCIHSFILLYFNDVNPSQYV